MIDEIEVQFEMNVWRISRQVCVTLFVNWFCKEVLDEHNHVKENELLMTANVLHITINKETILIN